MSNEIEAMTALTMAMQLGGYEFPKPKIRKGHELVFSEDDKAYLNTLSGKNKKKAVKALKEKYAKT